MQPLRGRHRRHPPDPRGCAARPTAAICNPCGVDIAATRPVPVGALRDPRL